MAKQSVYVPPPTEVTFPGKAAHTPEKVFAQVSKQAGNALTQKADGLFVNPVQAVGDDSIYLGDGDPSSAIPKNYQFYIDKLSAKLYTRESGNWIMQVQLCYPVNRPIDGSVWTTSTSVPSGGKNGDFHFRYTTGDIYVKSGNSWNLLISVFGQDFPAATITTIPDAVYVVTNADLSGNKLLVFTSATNVEVTVPTGLTGKEPAQMLQKGMGKIHLNGPATVLGSNGVKTRTQYAFMSLIPLGSDEYVCVGDTIPEV